MDKKHPGPIPVQRARNLSRTAEPFAPYMCLQRTRELFGIPAQQPDATRAWLSAIGKHTAPSDLAERLAWFRRIPAGAPLFWTGGSQGHGHIGVKAADDDYLWSVDVKRLGHWDRVRLVDVWSSVKFAGWAEGFNGHRVMHWDDTHFVCRVIA